MIKKILKSDLCAGCGLCQSVFGSQKLTVELNNNGFYRPKIHDILNKKENKLLTKICPGFIVRKERNKEVFSDSIWGEMFSCFVGAAKENEIREEASSGGAISAILVYLLETKKVSAVIHIGASVSSPLVNETKISTSKEQIIANANSRYSPSAPLMDILDNLKKYDSYAFVGKPCDVAGLRQLSNYNFEVKNKIKYYISFFCAGVPSLNATKDIAEAMNVDLNEISSLYYRKDGWPGYFKIIDKNKNQYKLSYSFTWMKLLGPKVQFRCKICADGVGHLSDIVCADAWDDFDANGFPTFKNAAGRSLIISRTQIGEDILQKAIKDNFLFNIKDILNIREIDKMQPGQLSKKKYHLARKLALITKTGNSVKFSSDFFWKATFRSSFFDFLKNFYGTLRRN
jgi:coenzyme F420 hydrogenase subunit beta